jgi:omega-amidase
MGSRMENPSSNLQWLSAQLESLSPPPGSLVVLPELFATGFSMNSLDQAPPPGHEIEITMADLAKIFSCYLLGGVATRHDSLVYNEAVAFGPDGKEVVRYQKRHLFSPAGEENHANPGRTIKQFSWGPWTVSPLICYDLRFPPLFQECLAAGTDLFVVLANWPAARTQHWQILLQSRAIEGQCVVAGLNRCGSDPQHSYSGNSMVVDHLGRIIATTPSGESVIWQTPNHADVLTWRSTFPAWKEYANRLHG